MIGKVLNIFCVSSLSFVFVGLLEKRMWLYFLCFDFRVASIFRFSFSVIASSLLRIRIFFALVWEVYCSDFWIWFRLSMTTRIVSVELIRDLLWCGYGGVSMIWIGASSNLNVPSCGL